MRSNKNLKVFLIILGMLFIAITVISSDFSNKNDNISGNDEISEVINDTNLKAAMSWVVGGEFVIDDSGALGPSYTWFGFNQSYLWCNGAGTWSDPYVIENVTFDVTGQYWGISIKNSNVPFIINNCMIKNSQSVGLELENVDNSLIINNKIYDNGHCGILAEGNNNTVSGNYVSNNGFVEPRTAGILFIVDKYGVGGIFYSSYNNISGNTVEDNSNGIAIRGGDDVDNSIVHCNNNSISGNNIIENAGYGIVIEIFGGEDDAENNRVYSSNNSITNNNITLNCWDENREGCGIGYKIGGENNSIIYNNFTTISGNSIIGNKKDGLLVSAEGEDAAIVRVKNITISGNIINENTQLFYADEWQGGNGILLGSHESDAAVVKLSDNTISGNTLIENEGFGIFLMGSNYTTLTENHLYGNGIVVAPDDPAKATTHTIDTTNKANDKPIYYYTNQIGLGTDNFTNAGQIIVIGCADSTISGEDVSNASVGILIAFGTNVTVFNNNASYGKMGMVLYYIGESNVTGNRANYNDDIGIYLVAQSNENNITDNIANNNGVGIALENSHFNLISGNTLLRNTYCIIQESCFGNILKNNNCGAAAPSGDDDDDDDEKEAEAIPGYDLIIFISTLFLLLGVIYVILVKKQLKLLKF